MAVDLIFMEEYFTLWLTGRPCSGKTTIAEALEKKLREEGLPVGRLDGNHVRLGLCKGLGFSKEGRQENLRRRRTHPRRWSPSDRCRTVNRGTSVTEIPCRKGPPAGRLSLCRPRISVPRHAPRQLSGRLKRPWSGRCRVCFYAGRLCPPRQR